MRSIQKYRSVHSDKSITYHSFTRQEFAGTIEGIDLYEGDVIIFSFNYYVDHVKKWLQERNYQIPEMVRTGQRLKESGFKGQIKMDGLRPWIDSPYNYDCWPKEISNKEIATMRDGTVYIADMMSMNCISDIVVLGNAEIDESLKIR